MTAPRTQIGFAPAIHGRIALDHMRESADMARRGIAVNMPSPVIRPSTTKGIESWLRRQWRAAYREGWRIVRVRVTPIKNRKRAGFK